MESRSASTRKRKAPITCEEDRLSWVPIKYDVNADVEDEYRVFLENVRVCKNGDFVLKYDGEEIWYGGEASVKKDKNKRTRKRRRRRKVVEVMVISSDDSANESNPIEGGATQQKAKKQKDKKERRRRRRKRREMVEVVVISSDESADVSNLVLGRAFLQKEAKELEENQAEMEEKDKTKEVDENQEEMEEKYEEKEVDDIEEDSTGVIWPAHINDREESEFKQGLIDALSKPFSKEEYDNLYRMATICKPVMMEFRTRSGSKFYYSKDRVGKSYLKQYPDLQDQVKETSHPNHVALLRGVFYWLENVAQQGRFSPWTNEHRRYKVIYS
uniref:Uncharacterized protein n=1 Tax=Leersia perrieri TaxID=77586 RepID=A0A0D9W2R0_9ORYZ